MKKHNLFKYVMITILVAVVLTWLFPITSFDANYGLQEGERSAVGVFSLVSYVVVAIQALSNVGIYVLAVGGLYGVLYKIPGYRNLIDKVVKGFKKREWLFMTIVMVVFALLSAMVGLSLALLVMFPFVISVVLAMGYDKITAAMVTVGSTVLGLVGSVFNIQNTYAIDMVLGTDPTKHVIYKLLLLVVVLVLLFINVMLYSKKHKTNKSEIDASYLPEASTAKKEKVWPIVVVLDLLLLVLALGFFSWSAFDITWFEDALTKVNDYKLFGFPILGSLLGLNYSFGNWSLPEALVLVLLASWLLSFIYKMKFNDYITNFMNGAKRALKPAVLVILLYVVLVISTYNPVTLTILKPLLDLTKGLNVLTMSVAAFVSSVFGVELNHAAGGIGGVLPYAVNVAYTNLAQGDITVLSLIWQSMYGLAMLVAPTSVILIATLAYLHIPYGKWLKAIWISLLGLVAVPVVIFAISMIV